MLQSGEYVQYVDGIYLSKNSLQAYFVSCIIIHKSVHGLWPCPIQNTSWRMWRRVGGRAMDGYYDCRGSMLPGLQPHHHLSSNISASSHAQGSIVASGNIVPPGCWLKGGVVGQLLPLVCLCECVCNCMCVCCKDCCVISTLPIAHVFLTTQSSVRPHFCRRGERDRERARAKQRIG